MFSWIFRGRKTDASALSEKKTSGAVSDGQRQPPPASSRPGNCPGEPHNVAQTPVPVIVTATGRDSLSRLRGVAKGQSVRAQGQGHWFAKQGQANIEVQTSQCENESSCPAVPEADRLKAIEELLCLGVEHFSVKREHH